MTRRSSTTTLLPYTTLFRSRRNRTSITASNERTVPPVSVVYSCARQALKDGSWGPEKAGSNARMRFLRSEEHTSELQSRLQLVCLHWPEKKNRRLQAQPDQA